ncbi:hypothetical protein LTR29_016317 [Friedmanniomyces endolithicus]|nr:hypothetical protein LTR29_016317 [Friedmanniomyces endolithicus]
MPTLARVYVPSYDRSPSTATDWSSQSRVSRRSLPMPRTYGKGPLSVKPSENSSVNARIVGRVVGDHGGRYSLKIGNEALENVGVEEILDYVSADHLEDYENQQFEEEREARRVAKEILAYEKMQRRNARKAKSNVDARHDDGTGEPGGDGSAAEVSKGRHGRARPTYKHLYPELEKRRRRKRDPRTNELMPLSDEEIDEAANTQSSGDDSPARTAPLDERRPAPGDEEKRRRRKRDPVTGELIPLAPLPDATMGEEKKRRRRKRHPITLQLMPYGWRYEPNGPSVRPTSGTRRLETGSVSPAMNRLSITMEQPAKRLKLGSRSSSGTSPPAQASIPASVGAAHSDTTSSSEDQPDLKSWMARSQSSAKQIHSASKGRLGVPVVLQSMATSSAPDTSPEPDFPRSAMQTLGAGNPSPIVQLAVPDSEGEESDEWAIEAILGHHMSDPRTHPREFGKKAVMLYQVKWEGFDETSWEPVESFPDRSVVEEYEREIGARAAIATGTSQNHGRGTQAVAAPSVALPNPVNRLLQPAVEPVAATVESSDDDSDPEDAGSDDGTYIVEAITAHHLSDPRTHAPEFGKKPVMLYKVKWEGYEGYTWEPTDVFEDRSVVREYRARVRLPAEEDVAMT